ncbi:dTDP-4-dehydrorhamnose 3,5-epimerase [Pseudooceanicola algae]|uniref:dTDP-4-dehydrorhamnose 3,5-epimerase n=1 Tax=Pseudooceanicola algae TaxID=1537215 RepID=A0A418SL19_9RHOB|nr:dTDP-4-dehydrorhamnose 3,5-epimerase [Pseudooceanicola algae]QPM90959.1 dTDP-4-dehydrorhamnose 3,5-epimerase [Pseudooceanicola algae]
MDVTATRLPEVLLLTPKRFGDERGFFSESWNRRTMRDAGLDIDFVQDNHSLSSQAGTLRGLHYQAPPHAQGKLVRCGRGRLFDVAVDFRKGSPRFGQWVGVDLSFDNGHQLWIPPGFLHGFVTREDATEIVYKCTDHYAPEADGAVHWDSLDIDWGVGEPVLSNKDAAAPTWQQVESPFDMEGGS